MLVRYILSPHACLCLWNQCSIETVNRMEMIFGTEKNEYLHAKITAYVFMELCPKVRTQKKISSRHIDRYKCSRIGFSTCPTGSLGAWLKDLLIMVRSWSGIFGHVAGLYHRHSRASLVKSTLHMPVCLSLNNHLVRISSYNNARSQI